MFLETRSLLLLSELCWVQPLNHSQSIFSAWLSFSPKSRKNVLYVCCINPPWMWRMRVCMDRLYLRWPITHLYSIGEIGWTRNKSCNLLILLDMFTSLNKNSVIYAFMGFIWCVTIQRLRHWSLQHVKWGEQRRSDTNAAPHPLYLHLSASCPGWVWSWFWPCHTSSQKEIHGLTC